MRAACNSRLSDVVWPAAAKRQPRKARGSCRNVRQIVCPCYVVMIPFSSARKARRLRLGNFDVPPILARLPQKWPLFCGLRRRARFGCQTLSGPLPQSGSPAREARGAAAAAPQGYISNVKLGHNVRQRFGASHAKEKGTIISHNMGAGVMGAANSRDVRLPNVVRPCCREAAALRGARHAKRGGAA